ncbi:MAG: DUF1636 domain-containing protein [Pseudomonadota bacterium]
MVDSETPRTTIILICSKCRGTTHATRLRATLAGELGVGFTFRAVNCLAGCDHPVSVGFQGAGKATYLFGSIESDEDIAALRDFALQYQRSDDGWTNASERPQALYTKTLARLPALATGPVA